MIQSLIIKENLHLERRIAIPEIIITAPVSEINVSDAICRSSDKSNGLSTASRNCGRSSIDLGTQEKLKIFHRGKIDQEYFLWVGAFGN